MEPTDKYCTKCGLKMIEEKFHIRFNQDTGKEEWGIMWTCPKWGLLSFWHDRWAVG